MLATITIAIDLSSREGTLALARDTNVLDEIALPPGRHSESLIPKLKELLERHSISVSSVDKWVVTRGPGSFTGLRIALSTLKAITLVHSKPILTVDGSEIRALAAYRKNPTARSFCVITELTPRRHLQTTFKVVGERLQSVEMDLSESLVVSDKGTGPTARLLLEHYSHATSAREFHSVEEIASLAPDYAGTTRFE